MKEVDLKILEFLEHLKSNNIIPSDYAFAKLIDRKPQHINGVRNMGRHFTLNDIIIICKVFNVDSNWFLGIENDNENLISPLSVKEIK